MTCFIYSATTDGFGEKCKFKSVFMRYLKNKTNNTLPDNTTKFSTNIRFEHFSNIK